jgi:hypothetical protein
MKRTFSNRPTGVARALARIGAVALAAGHALAAAGPVAPAESRDIGVCQRHMSPPPRCRWVTGTVAIFDAAPAIRLRQRGVRRLSAIGPPDQEWMPDNLRAALGVDNAVEGRLKICPIGRARDAGLRMLCVDEARALRSTDRKAGR